MPRHLNWMRPLLLPLVMRLVSITNKLKRRDIPGDVVSSPVLAASELDGVALAKI